MRSSVWEATKPLFPGTGLLSGAALTFPLTECLRRRCPAFRLHSIARRVAYCARVGRAVLERSMKRISAKDAKELMDEGWTYVDVRSEPEFERGHPAGA